MDFFQQPPEAPFDRHRLSDKDLLKVIATDYASMCTTEAPWYGVWNMVLTEAFSSIDKQRKVATIVVPQLPVTADFAEEEDDYYASTTPSPTRPRSPSSDSSDPLNLHSDSSDNTVDISSIAARAESVLRTESPIGPFTIKNMQIFRSTRIPDFVRLRLYLDADLKIVNLRKDLVVELKLKGSKARIVRNKLLNALSQASQQALHVFHEDETLPLITFIVASGNVWSFGCQKRTDVAFELKRHHRGRDGTYEPSPSQSSCADNPDSSEPGSPTQDPIFRPNLPNPTSSRSAYLPASARGAAPGPSSMAEQLNNTKWPKTFTQGTIHELRHFLAMIAEYTEDADIDYAPLYTTQEDLDEGDDQDLNEGHDHDLDEGHDHDLGEGREEEDESGNEGEEESDMYTD